MMLFGIESLRVVHIIMLLTQMILAYTGTDLHSRIQQTADINVASIGKALNKSTETASN